AIVLDDPGASRAHAALELDDGTAPAGAGATAVTIADLGSTNGTFVGGERLAPGTARRLAAREAFSIGDLSLVIHPSGLRSLALERRIAIDELAHTLARVGARRGNALAFAAVRVRDA